MSIAEFPNNSSKARAAEFDVGDGGAHRGFIGDVDGVGAEAGVHERLRTTRETMDRPAFGQQALGQSQAEATGGTGNESNGGHGIIQGASWYVGTWTRGEAAG